MKQLIINSVILVFIIVAYVILPPERTCDFLVTSFGSDSIAVYDSLGSY